MNSLKIESTAVTPEISFDVENSTLSLLKVSKPENTVAFYKPLFDFIDQFEQNKVMTKKINHFKIDFKFEYFNTSSAKIIHQLLERFKKMQAQGINLELNWFYHPDDEDMLEDGQIISEAQDLDFNFISTEV